VNNSYQNVHDNDEAASSLLCNVSKDRVLGNSAFCSKGACHSHWHNAQT